MFKQIFCLFAAACFSFGCSEDEPMIEEEPSVEQPSAEEPSQENFFGYEVEDKEGFDLSTLSWSKLKTGECDSVFLYGLKNEKIWVGLFDENTKKQLHEWCATEVFNRNFETDWGYGEVEAADMDGFRLLSTVQTSWGFAAVVEYYHDNNGDKTSTYYRQDLLVLKGDEATVAPSSQEASKYRFENIMVWFQESLVVEGRERSNNGDTFIVVLSPELKQIATLENLPWGIPLSYTEGIFIESYYEYGEDGTSTLSCRFYKSNFQTGEEGVWGEPIPSLQGIKDDARIAWALVEQTGPVWKFRIDVTNYDGSKQQTFCTVNVETGEVAEK